MSQTSVRDPGTSHLDDRQNSEVKCCTITMIKFNDIFGLLNCSIVFVFTCMYIFYLRVISECITLSSL